MSKLGVLMPCKGYLPHVKAAVESILNQTYQNFDFFIINDASETPVREYLETLRDPRIQIIHHENSQGVAKCLNIGLRLLSTDIVLRMDSDDIARPDRFALQYEFLERHPEIGVLGGQISNIESSNPSPRVPLKHPEIGYRLNWSNALNHPTVAYRRKVVLDAGGYDESLGHLEEDFELWCRLFFITQLANIPQCLLDYRVHLKQTTKIYKLETENVRSTIRQNFRYKMTGFSPSILFDYPERWPGKSHPSIEEWEGWQAYLKSLKSVIKNGAHGNSFNPARDIARRYWHSALKYIKVGGNPGSYRYETRQLSRWYALTKGIL